MDELEELEEFAEYTWKNYQNQIMSLNDISEEKKMNIINSMKVLENTLGDNWLKYAVKTNHPMIGELGGTYLSPNESILPHLADSLQKLKNVKGFDELLERIRSANEYEATTTELEFANKMLEKCTSLILSPDINGKKPDIFCKYKNNELFFEIKTLLTAEQTKKANRTSREIISATHGIFPCGKIFKVLSDPHSEEIKIIIEDKSKEARATKTPKEVYIENVLKILLVPDGIVDRVKIIQSWCNDQDFFNHIPIGQKGGLIGPDDEVKPESRIKLRLENIRKRPQIPDEKLGAIVLSSKDFYIYDEQHASRIVNSIIESVYDLRTIPAVVLYENGILFGDLEKKTRHFEDFIYVQNPSVTPLDEFIVIIKNRFCKVDFNYEILIQLFSN